MKINKWRKLTFGGEITCQPQRYFSYYLEQLFYGEVLL